MSYPVNPNDPTTPTDQQGAKQGAEEFRALKALVAALAVAGVAAPGVRQAIQSAKLDSNGLNTAITTGVGLRPGLSTNAGLNPLHLSFAKGFSAGGSFDDREVLNADIVDILGANLPVNNTSYIYRSFGVNFGSTVIPPDYGYTFDRAKQVCFRVPGINGAITSTEDFGNPVVFGGNANIATAKVYRGCSMVAFDGVGDSLTFQNITLGSESWTLRFGIQFNTLPGAGTDVDIVSIVNAGGFGFILRVLNTAGTYNWSVLMSSNGTSSDILAGTIGGSLGLVTGTTYEFAITYDQLAGKYFFYKDGALVGASFITTASKICGTTTGIQFGIGSASPDFNGWIGATEFTRGSLFPNGNAYVVSAVAPTITDNLAHFFSIPEMVMYTPTVASTVAGVNPTLTPVSRLFLAEADTSGVGITAVRNYAVRGQFVGSMAMIAQNTTGSMSHNIGVTQVNAKWKVRIKTAGGDRVVGEEVDINMGSGDSVNPRAGNNVFTTKLVSKITNDNLLGIRSINKAGNIDSLYTVGNDLVLYAQRMW